MKTGKKISFWVVRIANEKLGEWIILSLPQLKYKANHILTHYQKTYPKELFDLKEQISYE